MAEQWENVSVDGSTMRAFVCTPGGSGPFPGVVVIQHASGVNPFIQEMTRRLASAGYFAVAPDLYHREDPNSTDDGFTKMGRLRDETVIRDVNAAAGYLDQHSVVIGDSIGITGFCMGGRVALGAISGVNQNMAPSCYLGETCYRPANWGPNTDDSASITSGFSPTYNTMAVSLKKKCGGATQETMVVPMVLPSGEIWAASASTAAGSL